MGKKATTGIIVCTMGSEKDIPHPVRFGHILDAVGDGITVQDEKGKIVYANKAAASLIGFTSVKDLLAVPVGKVLGRFRLVDQKGHPLKIDKFPGNVALKGKKSSPVIVGFQEKGTKETRWSVIRTHSIYDKVQHVQWTVNLFQEITELQKSTNRLLFQKALLEAENEASQDGKLVISPTGRTVSFNKKFLELWNVSADQLGEKTERERLNLLKKRVTKPKLFVAHAHNVNAHPNKVISDEIELADGRWLERYTTPLKGPHKEHYGRIWFARDITERKKESIRQEVFLGLVSHELRTPLASIKAYIHLIASQIKKNSVQNILEYIGSIDGQTNKLNKLIKDLLDLSTVRADKLKLHTEIFDFDEFLLQIVKDLRLITPHTITVKGLTNKYIEGDILRLGEVFTNLMRNAIKYSPDADKIVIKLTSDRQNIRVSITDYGVGIPKKKIPRIFELFFRVSHTSGISGFGVGLYISHEIVKRHKGSLTVVSELRKGSTFTVKLPVRQ